MIDAGDFRALVVAWIALGAVVMPVLLLVAAPYGRHRRPGWGAAVAGRTGWLVMEMPAVVIPAALFVASDRTGQPVAIALFCLWELHYVQRALIFPLLLPRGGSPMPVVVAALGFLFNVANGVLQAGWWLYLGPPPGAGWLTSPPFLTGTALFVVGLAINWHADAVLRGLRAREGPGGYRVPAGGLFELVSCPNYLGEIVEWVGWAVATWSLPGAAFAFWTVANLVPRALAHHRWYRERFPGYPPERRAVIPFLL